MTVAVMMAMVVDMLVVMVVVMVVIVVAVLVAALSVIGRHDSYPSVVIRRARCEHFTIGPAARYTI
jgi:hypothetical protein